MLKKLWFYLIMVELALAFCVITYQLQWMQKKSCFWWNNSYFNKSSINLTHNQPQNEKAALLSQNSHQQQGQKGKDSQSPPQLLPAHYHKPPKPKKPRVAYTKIHFDDPNTFNDSTRFVEGWPPSRSRSIPLYIKPDEYSFNVIPSREKLLHIILLVVVHTRIEDFEERDAIRNSWGTLKNNQTSIVFLIGNPESLTKSKKEKLETEKSSLQDIIQVDDLIENYYNLTLKTLFMLKFFLDPAHFGQKHPLFLMKVDGDIFINLPLIYKMISEDKKYAKMEQLLMGHAMRQPNTILQQKSKWFMPSYLYNEKKYPDMVSGGAYIMSWNAAECLYSEALALPYIPFEDVLVTGFAADACNIERIHNPGFNLNLISKLSYNKDKDISIHSVPHNKMKDFLFSV